MAHVRAGFGRAVASETWSELLRDYDLRKGRLWSLVLLWMALGPLVVRRQLLQRPDARARR